MLSYDDIEYAKSRLLETIVRKDNVPVWVMEISRIGKCTLRTLADEKMDYCSLSELDINPVPLGYINSTSSTYYTSRTPMRRDWKQGLRNLSLRDIHGRAVGLDPVALDKTIRGVYPKVKDCFSSNTNPFVKQNDTIAFSRNFAIETNKNSLWYKGKWLVGDIDKNKSYKIRNKFDWIREVLEQELAVA